MYGDNTGVGPSAPMVGNDIVVIPVRIWKNFLAGTCSWMWASILYMILGIMSAVYYVFQNERTSQIILGINYIFSILTIYWLSANVRDVYRYNVLRSDPHLRIRLDSGLISPGDFARRIRVTLSVLGVLVALAVFVISIIQATADKITGCVVELQLVASTAILTKTFQDRQDAEFLSLFETSQANNRV